MLDSDAAGGLLIRGGTLRLGSYVAVVALSVLSAALLTRHLGVARFGQYTVVLSLVGVVASVTDVGMSQLGTREYAVRIGADRDGLMRDLLGLRVALTLVGLLLALVFALLAGYSPALVAGTVLAALSVMALVYQHTLSIPLSTALRLGALAALDVARQAMSVALIVALVLAGAGITAFLAVALVVNVFLIVPTASLARGKISMRMAVHPRAWIALLRLTASFSLASAVGTIYVYAAQILTSLVASPHQNGLFAASFRIYIVISAVPGLLAGAALPVLARAARDDHSRLAYALQRMFHVSLIVGVAAALGCLAGARFMIAVVAGPHFAGAAEALQVQGLALIASFLLAGWGYALLSLRRHRGLLFANGAALAVSATLTIALASVDGARGAALATVCGESVLALGYLIALVSGDREFRPRLGVVAKVVVAGAPAAALALVPDIPSLVRAIAVLALYGVLIVALRATPPEIFELLPARMRRPT
ncbi:MAG TPA: oligosaccharide flippase family protein [Solirubrobacteraceae bacterium]|nr:oligosaccharide flippase family protein [Solirubrobacteraceae bacterium]